MSAADRDDDGEFTAYNNRRYLRWWSRRRLG